MKQMRKLLSVLLAVLMVFSLMSTAFAVESDESLEGKVVILHSNDVHGALDGYAKIAGLRDEYVKAGAEVILADVGDYSQGTTYVSVSKGATAIEMMNAAGYDVATLGNHEFDFGYENLMTNLKDAKFKAICGDVIKDGKSILDGWTIIEKKGVKIGFVGLETPETYTKVNPGLIQGISFPQKEELYQCAQTLVNEVKAAGADIVVGLFHLGVDDESIGNRSLDVYANVTGLDIILDGHSHTVMTAGDNGEPIQSTGTKFENVGAVVIDPTEKKISTNYLVKAEDIADNADVLAKAKEIEKKVDDEYGAVFAKSDVELNGDKAPGNRNQETNLGDLITDSMVWSVMKGGDLKVPAENVVAITNGGGIRAWIHKGDISMKDVNTVLPFGNTIAVVYVTGAELLEALEASTYCTPTAVGGFPQVSGLDISINTEKEYDQGDQYPSSTYYGPKSIQRVTINSVNGMPFDADDNYAVISNNFCAAGGDTYYAFKAASDQFDTSIPLDEALMDYIKEELGGVIGEEYAAPQGRIFIGNTEEIAMNNLAKQIAAIASLLPEEEALTEESAKAISDALEAADKAETSEDLQKALDQLAEAVKDMEFKPSGFDDVKDGDWFAPAVDFAVGMDLMVGTGNNKFEPYSDMTRAMVVTVLHRMAGEPKPAKEAPFTDLKENWYKDAVAWACEAGITVGTGEGKFSPDDPVSREQMATFLARFLWGIFGEEPMAEELRGTLARSFYSDAGAISGYAVSPVFACTVNQIMQGDKAEEGQLTTFRPKGTMNRAECAQVLLNVYCAALDSVLPADDAPAENTASPAAVLNFRPAA